MTALFEDGKVSGTDGCNNYAGSYTVDGTSLTVGPELMGTMMACPGPIMDQASAYTAALTSAASYAIVNNQLRILNESGRTVVTYDERIPTSLTGTTWQRDRLQQRQAGRGLHRHRHRDHGGLRRGWHALRLGRLQQLQRRLRSRRREHQDRSGRDDHARCAPNLKAIMEQESLYLAALEMARRL